MKALFQRMDSWLIIYEGSVSKDGQVMDMWQYIQLTDCTSFTTTRVLVIYRDLRVCVTCRYNRIDIIPNAGVHHPTVKRSLIQS